MLQKWIQDLVMQQEEFVKNAKTAKAYYFNQNTIKRFSAMDRYKTEMKLQNNPLRNADNRISHNFHNILVNQKAAYLFTYPPVFDTGNKEVNALIKKALGSTFPKTVKDLCIEASNTGVGWLHIWMDEENRFRFHTVSSEEIIPVYDSTLDRKLKGALRVYAVKKKEKGLVKRYEYWDEEKAVFFQENEKGELVEEQVEGAANFLFHPFKMVPFIPFYNNNTATSDLIMYRDLIDEYDKVVSGYANDLEDIQETIFIIRNYGGEDLATFLSELKRYKAIKVDGDANDGNVETMQIEIPIEARIKFLELLKKQIFISGQGVNPDHEHFGETSGVALKYLYSLLELKAGLLETEFRLGFDMLLKAIFTVYQVKEDVEAEQIYTRNGIINEVELTGIAKDSAEILSQKTILKNHPWVEDVDMEMKMKKEDE